MSGGGRTSGRGGRGTKRAREHASLGAELRMQPGVTLQAAGQEDRQVWFSLLPLGGSEDKEGIDCCRQQRNQSEVEVGHRRSGYVFARANDQNFQPSVF